MSNKKSQFGQDEHVINVIYKGKKNGYFVEVGAYDGIESSNTYLLEKDYDWKGICVECNTSFFNKLSKNRNSINIPYAVYKEDDLVLDFYNSGGYSGLVETNNHKHIINDEKIKVQTKKLTTILEEAGAPNFIDFLSLDTEGSEYEILKSHDFTKFLFGYICVEHNRVEPNRTNIRNFLTNNGYIFYRENGDSQWGVIDDEYIHSSLTV